jgi:hypothetical protein
MGSMIYSYELYHRKIDFSLYTQVKYDKMKINYQLRPPHFLITMYYLLKEDEKQTASK